MRIEKKLSYEEVRAAFLRENPLDDGSNKWAFGALEIASKQFDGWVCVVLSLEDILRVNLSHHKHENGQELVPESGSTVSKVVEELKSVPQSDPCRRKINELSSMPASSIFLSAAPINHPGYNDYRGLIDRGCEGLTHLDGLHRLMGWAAMQKSGIKAYVAGLTPAS